MLLPVHILPVHIHICNEIVILLLFGYFIKVLVLCVFQYLLYSLSIIYFIILFYIT